MSDVEESATVWLTRSEVARELGVSVQTVYRWTREGRLPAYRTPGGQYQHKASDIASVREKVAPKPAGISADQYAEMIETMLGPAESEGEFTYADDDKEW